VAADDQDDVARPFRPGPAWPRGDAVPAEHRPLGHALLPHVIADSVAAEVGDLVLDARGRWCIVCAW